MDFQSPGYFVILDFEATCTEKGVPRPQEIIEFPSVIVNSNTNQEISRFQRYIRPEYIPKLTDFCTELTGITQKKVDEGLSFREALKEYGKWLAENDLYGDNHIIITCGNWDLESMYPRQCKLSGIKIKNPFKRWVNIKDVYKRFYGVSRPGGMTKMLESLNLELEGRHHSGIDDCHNTARIWIKIWEDGMRLEERDIHYLRKEHY